MRYNTAKNTLLKSCSDLSKYGKCYLRVGKSGEKKIEDRNGNSGTCVIPCGTE